MVNHTSTKKCSICRKKGHNCKTCGKNPLIKHRPCKICKSTDHMTCKCPKRKNIDIIPLAVVEDMTKRKWQIAAKVNSSRDVAELFPKKQDRHDLLDFWLASPTLKWHFFSSKNYHLKRSGILNSSGQRFGVLDFVKEYNKQNGKCKVCPAHKAVLFPTRTVGRIWAVVDHNHITGKFRGILCNKCNTMIGMSGENKSILARGIDYIHQEGDINDIIIVRVFCFTYTIKGFH